MTAHVVAAFAGGGLGRMLVQGVARDLTKRGVKAIEAFGDAKFGDADDGDRRLRRPGRLLPRRWASRRSARTRASRGCGWSCGPRCRWKSDVEYALEKLLGSMSPETLLRPVRPAPGSPRSQPDG